MSREDHLPVISEEAVRGHRVIVRTDFDVSFTEGVPSEDFRIRRAIPTIRLILRAGGYVRVITHAGRPKGKPDSSLSMTSIAAYLERLIGQKIRFIPDPFDQETLDTYRTSSEVLMFENVRFWKDEYENSNAFARKIVQWGDVYINEAFANCHRSHASMVALARMLPHYAGLALAHELKNLERIRTNPEHPFVAILGGAKLETKLPLVKKFLEDADVVFLGGVLANTVFASKGVQIGSSKHDREKNNEEIETILKNGKLILPVDVVTTASLAGARDSSDATVCPIDAIKPDEAIVDVGPESLKTLRAILDNARTIVWNGPLGFAEHELFAQGTKTLARMVAEKKNAFRIVGGGDTIAAIGGTSIEEKFTHVSAGGGAMLAFLAGEQMPGIEVLLKQAKGNMQ